MDLAWSRKFEKCINCGGTETKYKARGLCVRCYEIDTGRATMKSFKYRGYVVPPLSDAEKGYIAGILDGEGSIGLYVYIDGNKKANLQITNTYKPVLEWILDKMNCGSIHAISKKHTGFPSRKQCYNWTLSSQPHIREVLKALSPFLQIKKEKATTLIDFINKHPDKRVGRP